MMKLRARVICVLVTGVTFFVTLLLYEEIGQAQPRVTYRSRLNSYRRPTEDVADDNIDAEFIRKGKLLKNLDDQQIHLFGQDGSEETDKHKDRSNKTKMHDRRIEHLLKLLEDEGMFDREFIRSVTLAEMTSYLGRKARAASPRLSYSDRMDQSASNYVKFHRNARAAALYDPDDPAIDGLLNDMATMPFRHLEMMEKGTELKLLITFKNNAKAVFKPMRWGRDYETLPNHYYFNDYERHNAEIAAFHLDRILGFYRVPPVTGRVVNMTSEIYMLAEKALRKTFYVSPVGNLCFFGECSYYCDSRHSFCGTVDLIEGSLMVWLPEPPQGERDRWKSPYRRSYSKFRKAEWEMDYTYCERLLDQKRTYLYPRFIKDLVDSHIFDFITGNMDRHHVEVFRHLRNESCPLHMDNGRGFGKTKVDEYSILEPLRQCCVIRNSTFLKIAKLYIGPERLSDLLDKSMKSDPVYPILLPGHLNAVDRRILHILRTVAACIREKNSIYDVIIDDPF